jgi:hypothetical protein
MIACTSQPAVMTTVADAQDSSDGSVSEGSEGTDDTEGDTGSASCDPDECHEMCGYDECGHRFESYCAGDTCICQPDRDCLPCEGPCQEWESCNEGFTLDGECEGSCEYEFEFAWDDEVGCVIQLNPALPDIVLPVWYVEIDGVDIDGMVSEGAVCDAPESWVLDVEPKTLTLCPTACELFEAAGSLVAGWGLNCS